MGTVKVHDAIQKLPDWARPWAGAAASILTDPNIAVGLLGLICVWAVWYSITRTPPADIPDGVLWLVGLVFSIRTGHRGIQGWLAGRGAKPTPAAPPGAAGAA